MGNQIYILTKGTSYCWRVFTGQKIRYLTSILHLSVPDMCSMNAKKHTLFTYISGTVTSESVA
jgi:hypothetical protein